jgi:hypothetical protein
MKIFFRLCLVAILVALGCWLWTVCFPSPEKVIRKRIAKVARLASFNSNEGMIAKAANANELAGCFSVDAEIAVDLPGEAEGSISGRGEISRLAMAARSSAKGMNVKLLDPNIKLSADRTEATVDLTGEASVPGQRDLFVQELKFFFRKIEGDWLMVRVETVRTLK